MIAAKELDNLVKNYQSNPSEINEKQLGEVFNILIDSIVERFGKDIGGLEEFKEHCIFACFKSVNRIDSFKGKAFNYFTTTIMCQMRQSYKTRKSYLELKV